MALTPCLTCGALTRGSYCGIHRPKKGRGSTRAQRKLNTAILERDGYRCRYCGVPASHVDHLHPLSRGGRWTATNMVACCARCNSSRRGSSYPEWRPG
jgi:5-methylcytosine-specific restriction endonuclease McrA